MVINKTDMFPTKFNRKTTLNQDLFCFCALLRPSSAFLSHDSGVESLFLPKKVARVSNILKTSVLTN